MSTGTAEPHGTAPPAEPAEPAGSIGGGWGSVRVRLSLLYSAVVFGLGAVLVSLVYIGLTEALRTQPVTEKVITEVPGDTQCFRMNEFLFCGRGVEQR
ncbi:MAG: hypothetical protein IT196_23875, partial [Acidimicrobiales bacterium]|nr:hypothetical protein [Acidimicrobiales bacterium]